MKSIIQGKILQTTYSIDNKRKYIFDDINGDRSIYTGKPKITKETRITKWETIKEFDEDITFNSRHSVTMNLNNGFSCNCNVKDVINLSEDESVGVEEKIFRVDLGAYIYRTDKVLKETELFKEKYESDLKEEISEFNKQMIESNEKLLAYCNLHKLDPSETDVYELAKIVYPDDYKEGYSYIKDGKFIIKPSSITISSADWSFAGISGSSLLSDATYSVLTTSKNR